MPRVHVDVRTLVEATAMGRAATRKSALRGLGRTGEVMTCCRIARRAQWGGAERQHLSNRGRKGDAVPPSALGDARVGPERL